MLTETSVTFSSSVEHSHMSTRISMIGRLAIALLDVLFRFIMQECKGTRVTLRNKAPRQPLWQNEYFRSRSTSRFQGILDDIVENWKSWKFFSSGESRRKSCDATTMTRWISDISHACSNHAYYMIGQASRFENADASFCVFFQLIGSTAFVFHTTETFFSFW